MQTIQISDMEKDFEGMLDRVEGGETLVIARHGRAVARISPEANGPGREEATIDRERVRRAVEGMKELRKTIGRLTLEEIISAKNEGRE